MPCYYCYRHFGSRSRQNMQKHSVPSRVDCSGTVRFLRGPDTRWLRRVYHLPRYGVGLHAAKEHPVICDGKDVNSTGLARSLHRRLSLVLA